MGLHYHESDARWYTSMWLLAVVFVIAALVIVWLAFSRVTNPNQQQAQAPPQTVVVPGPQGPPGPPGPPGPAGQSAPAGSSTTPGNASSVPGNQSGQASTSNQGSNPDNTAQ